MLSHTMFRRLAVTASAMCGLAISTTLLAQDGPGTTITDLGTLGGPSSRAFAINAAGYITGSADLQGNQWHAFVSRGDEITDLGTIGDYLLSFGNDINNRGQIVGQSYFLFDGEATVWDKAGPYSLGLYLDYPRSEAHAINERGDVVGYAWDDLEFQFARPLLWTDGQTIDLGTPKGYSGGRAEDINNEGTIVGVSWNESQTETIAWITEADGALTPTPLPGLGGSESAAEAINERGDIVGYAQDETEIDHPVLWANGDLVALGTIAGQDCRALGINNTGLIVGYAWREGMTHADAALWKDGSLFLLNDLLSDEQRDDWELVSGWDINERGQIVGIGFYQGMIHGYLLEVHQLHRPMDQPGASR